ncbi:hypothetical protein AWB74_08884 [Caballeronia arvi]|uniref:Uncharacterized protein n=1 Tax=Caballeronia arvi TaxID=1777135 RepID=A0A158L6I0_9BURK|nr:hypothetical protein AWB74_08884 [Caballeronia arvi]
MRSPLACSAARSRVDQSSGFSIWRATRCECRQRYETIFGSSRVEPNVVWFEARRARFYVARVEPTARSPGVCASRRASSSWTRRRMSLTRSSITRRLRRAHAMPAINSFRSGSGDGSVTGERSRRGWRAALRPVAGASTRPTRRCARAACVVARCRATEKDDDEERSHRYRRSRVPREAHPARRAPLLRR